MKKFLLGILISLPVLFAQPMPMHQMHKPEMPQPPSFEDFTEHLGLKSAQRQKLLDIWFMHRKDMIDLTSNIKKMEIDMRRLLMAEKLDEKKLIEKAKLIGEARVKKKIEGLKFKLKVLKLAPEKYKDEIKRFLFSPRKRLLKERLKTMRKKGRRK